MKLSKEVAVLTALGTYLAPRLAQDAAPVDLLRLMAQHKRPAAIASAVKLLTANGWHRIWILNRRSWRN